MNDLCFLDLETTGFDPDADSIIEISFVRYRDDQLVAEMDKVCTASRSPLTPLVTQITGIHQEEIDRDGEVFTTLLPEIQEKIGQSTIVGHNIDFDINFLKANGVNLEHNPRIDTHELARILLVNEESYALEILSQKYGFTHENAHRAMSDVLASRDLLNFLLPKLSSLPKAYLEAARPILEKSTWEARHYFLTAEPNSSSDERKNLDTSKVEQASQTPNPSSAEDVALPSPGVPLLVRITKATESVAHLEALAQKHPDEKFIISTSKDSFFKSIPPLFTPKEILDPERLFAFFSQRPKSTDQEITFFLKTLLRFHLGLLQQASCDLFFGERDWWKEICLKEASQEGYQTYLKTKESERVLLTTHTDFLSLLRTDCPLLTGRLILIDEGEVFVQNALMSTNKAYSLWPYLDTSDEDLATKTQFFVTHFCRQVIESTLKHEINPFPLKLALPPTKYEKLAEIVRTISPDETIEDFAQALEHPQDYDVRWAYYRPDNGSLTLNTWNQVDWKQQLKKLAQFRTIILHHHNLEAQNDRDPDQALNFFQLFLNPQSLPSPIPHTPYPKSTITIPEDVMAATSPDYYEYCASKILETAQAHCHDGGWIAVNCSSQSIMRSIYELVSEKNPRDDLKIMAERLSGGDGKITQILDKNKTQSGILFYQNLLYPVLQELEVKAVILQKFPFPFPHPITEYLERKISEKNISFWDHWTIPLVATKLHRNMSGFSGNPELIVIDPRENAKWAKAVWRNFK
ncbi:MAG TPA: exonuclease domain-containing protein [Candidatus Gracilibacteria bacterium]